MHNAYNKKFTPKYDDDLIPKWYLDQLLNQEAHIIGEIKSYSGNSVPKGWLLCNGSEISRNGYKKLYDTIGTSYGTGDGVSTFNLPTYVDNITTLGYMIIKY